MLANFSVRKDRKIGGGERQQVHDLIRHFRAWKSSRAAAKHINLGVQGKSPYIYVGLLVLKAFV